MSQQATTEAVDHLGADMRALVKRVGVNVAARMLGMSRETVVRLCGGILTKEGSRVLARQRLDAISDSETKAAAIIKASR